MSEKPTEDDLDEEEFIESSSIYERDTQQKHLTVDRDDIGGVDEILLAMKENLIKVDN